MKPIKNKKGITIRFAKSINVPTLGG